MIPQNPATHTIRPKAPETEKHVLNDSQISHPFTTIRDTQWVALIHLAVSKSMRQSELLGLRWVDLD